MPVEITNQPRNVELKNLSYDANGRSAEISLDWVHPRGYPRIERLNVLNSAHLGGSNTTLLQVPTESITTGRWDIYIMGRTSHSSPYEKSNPVKTLKFVPASANMFIAKELRNSKTNVVHVEATAAYAAVEPVPVVKLVVTGGGDITQYSEHPYWHVIKCKQEYTEVISGDSEHAQRLSFSFRLKPAPEGTKSLEQLPQVSSIGHGGTTPKPSEWLDTVQFLLHHPERGNHNVLSVSFRFVEKPKKGKLEQGKCIPRLYNVESVDPEAPTTEAGGRIIARHYVVNLIETQDDQVPTESLPG